jgi:hypothetical protein
VSSTLRVSTLRVSRPVIYQGWRLCSQREQVLQAKLQRTQQLLRDAKHRRGHARHVIDLPAHVVKQYRDTILECQRELASFCTSAAHGSQAFTAWFVGDQCVVRGCASGDGDAHTAEGSHGVVAYVGPVRALGRGVWIGVR